MSDIVHLTPEGKLDEKPMTLQDIALKYIAKNLNTISTEIAGVRHLNPNIILSSYICDLLLEAFQQFGGLNDGVVNIFQDVTRTSLKIVNLKNCVITDAGLLILLRHNLHTLTMWHCDRLSTAVLLNVPVYSGNLQCLEVGNNAFDNDESSFQEDSDRPSFELPSSRRLMLYSMELFPRFDFSNMLALGHLDLSACRLSIFTLRALAQLPVLRSLILFNVWLKEQHIDAVCLLSGLRKLDISVTRERGDTFAEPEENGIYPRPNETLAQIVESLSELTHLDISGTNLAGTGVAVNAPNLGRKTDIPGLESRVERPLEFLGLYRTAHFASCRHHVPALKIAGDANASQLILAAKCFFNKRRMLTQVLHDLCQLYIMSECEDVPNAMDAVLTAMDGCVSQRLIQISGTAILRGILRGLNVLTVCYNLRKHIITTLLNGMESHTSDSLLMLSCIMTLQNFDLAKEALFVHDRMAKVLLHVASPTGQADLLLSNAVYLLHVLSSALDPQKRLMWGEMGAIRKMIYLIEVRLRSTVYHHMLESAWGVIWNLSRNVDQHCNMYLNAVCRYFIQCCQAHPYREQLVRKMMGVLAEVATVEFQRPILMEKSIVLQCFNLINFPGETIQVSYSAAFVLTSLASDDIGKWRVSTPTRDDVLGRLECTFPLWDQIYMPEIAYSTLEPIFRLANCFHTPQCQYFGLWALANLTMAYPNKLEYRQLLKRERGIEILRGLLTDQRSSVYIKTMAYDVINVCGTLD